MNNLELCQFTRQQIFGENFVGPATPTTVVGQTGPNKKIVDAVREGWVYIQNLSPFWAFLRATKQYTLTANVRTYSLLTDLQLQYLREFDLTKNGSFIEETSADKTALTYEDWEDFRARVISETPARPSIWTVNPSGEVEFNVIPDTAYVVRWHYWMTAEVLDDDTDVPAIAEELHEVIGWEAVKRYAGNDTSSEMWTNAESKQGPLMTRLVQRYLPRRPTSTGAHPPPGMR